VTVDKVTDEMLLGKDACLYRISAEHRLDLSPDVKARTGIWFLWCARWSSPQFGSK
jgi:hypothetical protein